MCRPASMMVLKDRVIWGQTDEHSALIEQHRLHVDGVHGPNAVPVEITPLGGDMRRPLDEWTYRVDDGMEDQLPKWYDADDAERRVRAELPRWVAARVVLPGESRNVSTGENVYAYGDVFQVVNGGTVQEVNGGGTVQRVYGGGTVIAYTKLSVDILEDATAVLVDRSGDIVKCYVGAPTPTTEGE